MMNRIKSEQKLQMKERNNSQEIFQKGEQTNGLDLNQSIARPFLRWSPARKNDVETELW